MRSISLTHNQWQEVLDNLPEDEDFQELEERIDDLMGRVSSSNDTITLDHLNETEYDYLQSAVGSSLVSPAPSTRSQKSDLAEDIRTHTPAASTGVKPSGD